MTLIGINGFKTSGKDTTYTILSHVYGDGDAFVQRVAFADKLKIMAALVLGYEGPPQELIDHMDDFKARGRIVTQLNQYEGNGPDDTMLGDPASIKTLSGREYLQLFGAKARDVFGDNFWIDQILPYPAFAGGLDPLPLMYPDADLVCVTDVRYPNEAQRVKALGGVVWEVLRPGTESDGHATETPLPPYLVDYKIINDGDLDVLEGRVVTALETL
jgi:hypothetical protein